MAKHLKQLKTFCKAKRNYKKFTFIIHFECYADVLSTVVYKKRNKKGVEKVYRFYQVTFWVGVMYTGATFFLGNLLESFD